MSQEKAHKVYKNLLDLINDYLKRDCSNIIETLQYKDLDNFFKSFFSNFEYDKIIKLYSNCYIYKEYIIKFSDRKTPLIIDKQQELVNSYYRQNIEFVIDNRVVLYLGVEIQDYLYPNQLCNEEELYVLYNSLRSKGYVWMDANLGNAVKYNGKLFIVDIDYIYPEKDAIYINQSKMSKEFEKRYISANNKFG